MEKRTSIKEWCESRMQYALTRRNNLFDFGKYAIVPNVGWGLGLNHESDLLCLSKKGVFHEVEIKVTMSDLKADTKKCHNHYSKFIKHLWFAIPDTLSIEQSLEFIPDYSGLVVVSAYYVEKDNGIKVKYINKQKYSTKIIRKPRPGLRKGFFDAPKQETIIKFLRLGVLRMWTDTKRFSEFDKQVIMR
jgi:hypothetical protein